MMDNSEKQGHPVTLIEGERDRKPRREASVQWPQGRPPGGRLSERTAEENDHQPQANQSNPRNPLNTIFLAKLASVGETVTDFSESPLSEEQLAHLARMMNEETAWLIPLFRNRPGHGMRPTSKQEFPIEACSGFLHKGTVRFESDHAYGPGLYCELEVLYTHESLVRSLIGTPFGVDMTAEYGGPILSIDLTTHPRGSGRILAQLSSS